MKHQMFKNRSLKKVFIDVRCSLLNWDFTAWARKKFEIVAYIYISNLIDQLLHWMKIQNPHQHHHHHIRKIIYKWQSKHTMKEEKKKKQRLIFFIGSCSVLDSEARSGQRPRPSPHNTHKKKESYYIQQREMNHVNSKCIAKRVIKFYFHVNPVWSWKCWMRNGRKINWLKEEDCHKRLIHIYSIGATKIAYPKHTRHVQCPWY